MNKPNGVWVVIIGILVAGVFVTRLTSNFVASDSLTTVAETEATENLDERFSAALAQIPTGAVESPDAARRSRDLKAAGALPNSAAKETSASIAQETAAAAENAGTAGETLNEAAAAVPEMAMFAAPEAESAAAGAEVSAASEINGAESSLTEETAAAETVKSPLEPGPGAPRVTQMDGAEPPSESAADGYRERLDAVAAQLEQAPGAGKNASANSALMEARYERSLWDNELNLIYAAIRTRMDRTEAEAIKQEELEWLKFRDAAADKAMRKDGGQTGQSAAYEAAAADATRERCYALVENYREILNRGLPDGEK